jgi:transcription initiation factor TFIID subunit 13
MTEVRMRLRQKGQQFPTQDCKPLAFPLSNLDKHIIKTLTRPAVEAFLLAFGDNDYPLPETLRILDEIITDYIIETCHEAASVAHHARRAKIKLDDFKFMLRRDTSKLGRVSEMLETDKELKRKRKAFDTDEGAVLGKGEKEDDGGKEGKEGRAKKGDAGEEEGRRKKKKKEKKEREDRG